MVWSGVCFLAGFGWLLWVIPMTAVLGMILGAAFWFGVGWLAHDFFDAYEQRKKRKGQWTPLNRRWTDKFDIR